MDCVGCIRILWHMVLNNRVAAWLAGWGESSNHLKINTDAN